jgi:hypothetical protein
MISLRRGHTSGLLLLPLRRGVERLKLREEAVALAVLAPGAGVLGAPVVLVHVLELLLALLGAPVVSQPRKLPAKQKKNEPQHTTRLVAPVSSFSR